ncbi:MAG: hypothetical protein ABFD86_08420 [Bryobacteraceae bacterium]
MPQDIKDGDAPTSPAPQYYVWKAEGKPIAIRLSYDVVDRLQVEVMQGFGAVPKRGAEVGGVLLGSSTGDGDIEVTIDDYALVPCEHRHGPSFLLSDTDREQFAAAAAKWQRGNRLDRYAIGYFRSNTRPEFSLSDDDLALWNEFLPDSSTIALLVKPFATKACQAGFFFKEQGQVRVEPPHEIFPFRRQDLGGGAPPRSAPAPFGQAQAAPAREATAPRERIFQAADSGGTPPRPVPIRTFGRFAVASPGPSPVEGHVAQKAPVPQPAVTQPLPPASRRTRRRVPLPLAFIFLLLGVLLGFQAALQMRPAPQPASVEDAVRLGLSIKQRGDNIQLTWNRGSPVILTAQRARLTIFDGDAQQATDLDSATLRSGNVIYRHITRAVRFRLEVFVPSGNSVVETAEWIAP